MNFTADVPTLPVFDDKQDNIDSYMDQFERFATVMKWKKSEWGNNTKLFINREITRSVHKTIRQGCNQL